MSLPYRALRYDLVQAAIHDGGWSSADRLRLVKMENMKEQEVGLELSPKQAMLKSPHESGLVKSRDAAWSPATAAVGLGKKLSAKLEALTCVLRGFGVCESFVDSMQTGMYHIFNRGIIFIQGQ